MKSCMAIAQRDRRRSPSRKILSSLVMVSALGLTNVHCSPLIVMSMNPGLRSFAFLSPKQRAHGAPCGYTTAGIYYGLGRGLSQQAYGGLALLSPAVTLTLLDPALALTLLDAALACVLYRLALLTSLL